MSRRWTIRGGGYVASVLAAGGGLGDLIHEGEPLVAGPGPGVVQGGRGQLLVPWPNRIRDGRYRFGGVEHQLVLDEPAAGNAIHGLLRWSAWRALDRAEDRIRVGCALMPRPGYPWELFVTADYRVGEDGLSVTLTAVNRSATPAPFAAGMHPYLDLGAPADRVRLHLPAHTRLCTDDRGLPLGTETTGAETTGADRDFSTPRAIGPLELDDAWTDLDRDADGWARIRLWGRRTVTMLLDPAFCWVQVFTGDTLASGRRDSIAVEPMTAPPDAFNSGTDLVVLPARARWRGAFRLGAD